MGIPRKNQPGYTEGRDKLGRRTWNRTAKAAPVTRRSTQPVPRPGRAALKELTGGLVYGEGPVNGWFGDSIYSDADLTNAQYIFRHIDEVRFDSCALDGALFTGMKTGACEMERVSFRGSSLRNATFASCDFYGVDFCNTDLTGARFSQCLILGRLDFHGSNVTGDQIDEILDWGDVVDHVVARRNRNLLGYHRIGEKEFSQKLGWDADEFFARLWVGDIEVRDNETRRATNETFNADRHHIPQWACNPFRPVD